MEDHTYSLSAQLTQDDEDVITMPDRTCTMLTQPDEAASGVTSKNTQSIYEDLFYEDIVYSSDCDNVDKDPNYISLIHVETTIDWLCTADVETHNNTGYINQGIILRKRMMSKNEKFTRQVKIKEARNKKQTDQNPIILKTVLTSDGKCKKQCPLFSNEHQKEIWLNYWKLNYSDC